MNLSITDTEKCIGCQSCMFACARRQGKVGFGEARLAVRSVGGMERGFAIIVCRGCQDPPCAKVCPTKALKLRTHGGVICDLKSCIGCQRCQDACLIGAIFWDEEINKPMICYHCGYCVTFCPHGVLKMIDGEEKTNAPS